MADNKLVPFFVRFLEEQESSQPADSNMSIAPEGLANNNKPNCVYPNWTTPYIGKNCILDTKKYPSDEDEQSWPR